MSDRADLLRLRPRSVGLFEPRRIRVFLSFSAPTGSACSKSFPPDEEAELPRRLLFSLPDSYDGPFESEFLGALLPWSAVSRACRGAECERDERVDIVATESEEEEREDTDRERFLGIRKSMSSKDCLRLFPSGLFSISLSVTAFLESWSMFCKRQMVRGQTYFEGDPAGAAFVSLGASFGLSIC